MFYYELKYIGWKFVGFIKHHFFKNHICNKN
jgi:hypothetical protein